jgi:hypothetical protein
MCFVLGLTKVAQVLQFNMMGVYTCLTLALASLFPLPPSFCSFSVEELFTREWHINMNSLRCLALS